MLRATGLLPLARGVRDGIRVARALPRNLRLGRRAGAAGLPVPPGRLVLLVGGTPERAWFLESGRLAAESLRSLLAAHAVDLDGVRSVLDFGCGCGRVIRQWHGWTAAVHGCDYNPRLIAWCRRHLGFARFALNRLAPPLPYPDAAFDLVYALSVFTHLPEALQRPWLEELVRVLEPGGHLVLSTHGPRYLDDLAPAERERFKAGGLVVRGGDVAGSNRCGAYHPPEYVEATLARGLRLVARVPEGARGNPHQDLYLLRKP